MFKLKDLIDEKKCGVGQNPEDTGSESEGTSSGEEDTGAEEEELLDDENLEDFIEGNE